MRALVALGFTAVCTVAGWAISTGLSALAGL